MQDSSLLRSVDRRLGSAICSGISALRFFAPKRKRAPGSKIQKILLVELFEMGAAIMLIPTLKYLKAEFPEAEIHCLTTNSCLPAWDMIGEIPRERIHLLNSKSSLKLITSALQGILQLRKHDFDLIIDYELFMRVPAILSGLAKAKERAGFYKYHFEGLHRGSFYEHKCQYNQNQHISKNYLALTKTATRAEKNLPNHKANIPLSEILFPPFIAPQKEILASKFAIAADQSIITICADVGPTLSMRNYPIDHFAKLIEKLHSKYPKHLFTFIGTAAEKNTSEQLIAKLGNPSYCLNLCGRTSFSDLVQVIACSKLLITNDNGPAHFATLTGTPTLTMFSTDSPYVYGPLGPAVIAYAFFQCSPCISAFNHKTSNCDNNLCLQALPPDTLLDLASALLEGKANLNTINNRIPYLA